VRPPTSVSTAALSPNQEINEGGGAAFSPKIAYRRGDRRIADVVIHYQLWFDPPRR